MGLQEASTASARVTAAAAAEPEDDGAPVRVHAHPSLCLGWGNCHRFAPEVYPLDDDGHVDVHRMEVPGELAHAARIGASVCPEQAISVIRTSTPPPRATRGAGATGVEAAAP